MDLIGVSKYIFIGLFAIFTLVSYLGATIKNKKTLSGIYGSQTVITIVFIALGNIILFTANEYQSNYLVAMFAEIAMVIVTIVVYKIAYKKASMLLVNNMLFLMSIGFIMIARLDFGNVVRQLVFAAAGLVITYFIPLILKKMRFLRNLGWVYAGIGAAMLGVVLVASRVTYGARISITIAGFTFQPSEFVKILFVLCIAAMFNKVVSWKQVFITAGIAIVHILILVASNDLGAAIIFFVVYLMMTYVATRKVLILVGGAGLGLLGAYVAQKFVPHVRRRFEAWQDPMGNIRGSGYQIAYSLFSLAAGGWFGTGLTLGQPATIPFVANDMIYAAIVEEWGMIAGILLLFICLNCLIIIMNIASKCNTLFYRLIAVGLGTTYAFQVFLTVGGTIKLIPLTGVTLPFISYGGSSIIASLIMFALINGMYNMRQVDISKEPRRERLGYAYKEREAVAAADRSDFIDDEYFNTDVSFGQEYIRPEEAFSESEERGFEKPDIEDTDNDKSKKDRKDYETGGYFLAIEDEYDYQRKKARKERLKNRKKH